VLRKHIRMIAILEPGLVFIKTIVQKYLKEAKERIIFGGNDSIEFEQRIEVVY
jgi:endo-1,4-beta-mannosidase